jgi:aryl-alcohol dehydrogenase-like predicted oxidoreductase
MDITAVGYGAWAIGGGGWSFGWGDQRDEDSVAAIRYVLERGVNWIDTAPAYGMGHSEEVVARAIRDIPEQDRPYVFTKCGLIVPEDRPFDDPQRIANEASLRAEVEGSLRRLGVDRIDLLQVHWPAGDGTPIEEYWGTLLDMKKEGKVRAVGLSNHDVDELDRAEAVGHVDTMQPPFSLISRSAAADLLPWCREHETGVIVYSPMQSGLLTGAFSTKRMASLDSEDWRTKDPEFTTNLAANLAFVDKLKSVAARHDTTPSAVAVAWVLAWEGVTGAIVGARQPAQAAGWLPGATLQLEDSDLHDLATALEETGAGSGPVRPGDKSNRLRVSADLSNSNAE